MSLARAVEQGPTKRLVRGCALSLWRDALPAAERAALDTILADRDWTARDVAEWINADPDYDVVFHVDVVRRHRRGECRDAR